MAPTTDTDLASRRLGQSAVDGRDVHAGAALQPVVEEQVAVQVGDEVGRLV